MDVPQGHWAYDAVGLLASRGIVSGYPDGAFKGAQPATRYEMASVVARALVAIDADKAQQAGSRTPQEARHGIQRRTRRTRREGRQTRQESRDS
ncbi:S-layer homology domain-containing protein [Cloacibacillus evryensis]|uniref:S-layer homology domain-containing protein n=1 Tax=Cloacibacillus evryensis TaxID=508460 RepID=UPI00316AD4B4